MIKISALALAASLCSLSAMAINGPAAFVPSQAGATVPDTATVATAWKLVGSLGASGVQIAPRWVLTAKHVNAKAGMTFTNAYGTSTVDLVIPAAGTDLALVRLSGEIAVPANELPALLSDALTAGSNNLPGHMLAAGRGGFGAVKAHWLVASEDTDLLFSSESGAVAVGGDSGSGVFWYPQPTARPILRSITAREGNPVGPNSLQVGAPAQATAFNVSAWIQASISQHGANAGAAPLWVASTSVAPHASRAANLPRSATVLKTYTTSAWLEWTPPVAAAAATPPVTAYVITLMPGGAQYTVPASQSVLTISGLQTSKTYSATVGAVNANGVSGLRKAVASPGSHNANTREFTTSPPPNALSALTYDVYTTLQNGQLKSCVRFYPIFATGGAPATALGIENYGRTNTPRLLPSGIPQDYCDLTPGASSTILVAPWNHLTAGPIKMLTIVPPAQVTGQPTNLIAAGKVIDGDHYLNVRWTKPNVPQPVATLEGMGLTIGCNNTDGVQVYRVNITLAPTVTNWTVSNVPPGGDCGVIVSAKWNRTIPNSQATALATIPE